MAKPASLPARSFDRAQLQAALEAAVAGDPDTIEARYKAAIADVLQSGQMLPDVTLSSSVVAENTVEGVVVGVIQGAAPGAALSLANSANGRFKIVGNTVQTGSVATDYETATSHNIVVRQEKAGAPNSPHDTPLEIGVTNVNDNPIKLLIEGDSITAPSGSLPTWAQLFAAENPTMTIVNAAVGGSSLNQGGRTLYSSKAADLAQNATHMVVFIGANDMMTYAGGTVQGFLNTLWGFTDDFRAAGTVVIIATQLSRSTGDTPGGWDAFRAQVRTALLAQVGIKFDAIIDWTKGAIGADGASDNTDWFFDKLHPTATGQTLLLPIARPVIRYAMGLANEPQGFQFAPQAAAVVDTDYDSPAYTVTGLGEGESRPYSVPLGVRVQKNAGGFVLNGAGTVVNGDTLRVRNRSSTTAATPTNVSVTIGSTTATYTVTTAGQGARNWIPTDLGAKLRLWCRPAGIPGANGDQINAWADDSGNNIAVSGFGYGSKPTVVTNSNGGKKAVRMQGSYGQCRFDLPAGFLGSRTSSSTFVVHKLDADPPASGFGPPPAVGWGTNGDGEFYPYSNRSIYTSYCSTTRNQSPTIGPDLSQWHVVSFHGGTNDLRYYIDGVIAFQLTSSIFALGGNPRIGYDGQTGEFNGLMQEFVDCSDSLTTNERQLLEGYLHWENGLQANLANNHPWKNERPTI